MKKLFFVPFFLLTISCWNGPAVNHSYDFTTVGSIKINHVNDHTYMPGSGEIVETSLSHNFLKYGFDVNEDLPGASRVSIGTGNQALELSCIITEYTDSELIIVPYHFEDRGSTSTTIKQSAAASANTDKAETTSSSTTKTDGGAVSSGSKIDYTRARVAIMLKMRDIDSGDRKSVV